MKKMLMGSAAAIAVFFTLGTAARSADIVAEPAMTDWSGFYIGAHLGYGWANFDGCFDCDDSSSVLFASDLDLEGIVGGLHAGYNWQIDSIVFGFEGDVTFTDLNDTEPEPEDDDFQHGDVDLLASVRARLGIAIEEDVLVFATGGIAIPDAEWSGDDAAAAGVSDFDFGEIGGVVGGGVEYAMSETFRLRAEGLYYFFDETESIDVPGAEGDIELDDAIVVRGGVSIYFNM